MIDYILFMYCSIFILIVNIYVFTNIYLIFQVLLFSTMVQILDIVEEFLIYRNYNYTRLDGTMKIESRVEAIETFNSDPECFIMMISTRAGGLGLNLTSADTVIIFDSDWV